MGQPVVQVQIYRREVLTLAGYKGDYELAPGPYILTLATSVA